MNPRSITFRLLVWYASLLTGVFLVLSGLFYWDVRNYLESDLRLTQLRRAHQLGSSMLSHVRVAGEPAVIGQIKDWYAPESNARFIRIRRGDGTLVYTSDAPKDGSFAAAEVPLYPLPRTAESWRIQPVSQGHTLLIASLLFKSPGNPAYFVEFGALLDPVESVLRHLCWQLALGLPLAIGLVTLGGYALVQRALQPVERITQAAEQITQLNISERLPVARSGDELERLSLALNRMIVRLDAALQNSKRFAADASHDLRTPLTILRGELESLVEEPGCPEHLRGRLADLLQEAIHLTKIVEQLFTLTQLDSGESRAGWKRFDLAELARTTADQMSLLAEDKQIRLQCDMDQPVWVEGDPSRIKQVIVNLLDNAIKYTPARGQMQISVREAAGQALLEVADSGIGIPREALPHVFERFFRVDKTRSAEAESAGLGLSIVKAICAAHGAEVLVASQPGIGSRFTVKMPLKKTATSLAT